MVLNGLLRLLVHESLYLRASDSIIRKKKEPATGQLLLKKLELLN